eukprot:6177803-Pleurochrysis_carterae.AAC.5
MAAYDGAQFSAMRGSPSLVSVGSERLRRVQAFNGEAGRERGCICFGDQNAHKRTGTILALNAIRGSRGRRSDGAENGFHELAVYACKSLRSRVVQLQTRMAAASPTFKGVDRVVGPAAACSAGIV